MRFSGAIVILTLVVPHFVGCHARRAGITSLPAVSVERIANQQPTDQQEPDEHLADQQLAAGQDVEPAGLTLPSDNLPANNLPVNKLPANIGTDVTLAAHVEAAPLRPPPFPGDGVEQSEWTLADLEGLAFANNPTLAIARAKLDSARGQRVQASLYPNTVVGYHATEVGNDGTAGQQGGFIGQKFITAGKLELDQQIAGQQIDLRYFQLHAQQRRVLSDVRSRFYDALVAQRRLELSRKLSKIGDRLAQATQRLVDSGQASENDRLQAEIEAERTHLLLDTATTEYAESRRKLAAVVGIASRDLPTLAGDLDANIPMYDWEDSYAMVCADNFELQAARADVRRARLTIARANRENHPNVDLFVSIRHHNISDSDVANIQLGMPVPYHDRNQGNIMRAHAELVAATNEVQRIELDLQDRLATAYRRYDNARQQTHRYVEKILPRAKSSLDIVAAGFDQGQVDYLTLITSQRTFIHVNLDYLTAMQELRRAVITIEGQLLTDSLARRP